MINLTPRIMVFLNPIVTFSLRAGKLRRFINLLASRRAIFCNVAWVGALEMKGQQAIHIIMRGIANVISIEVLFYALNEPYPGKRSAISRLAQFSPWMPNKTTPHIWGEKPKNRKKVAQN